MAERNPEVTSRVSVHKSHQEKIQLTKVYSYSEGELQDRRVEGGRREGKREGKYVERGGGGKEGRQ